ncbi:hypothetical protein [Acinetobacter courvalinii]|uniref:Lipoprotein n=1 Tax=Acinetobacter courvalinii TaxID=280147 RepID=A0AA42I7A3_9GAMM|nr:hypothetical protein [Acinetobacter courvalinii]MDH0563835.1 hypothetical protein [Acinetobacter courvalinii]
MNNKTFLIITTLLMIGCSFGQERAATNDPCQEEADVAETVMDMRLNQSNMANAMVLLAGSNEELREQLKPILHDAFEYDRGGTATFDRTKQMFRDKYYQQCMQRQGN